MTASPPPIPARIWKIAAVTGAGAFMAMLDSTVANLALESVRADFGTTLSVVQWVVTGYLIALAVSLPAASWLGSRYGYGRLWAGALAVFVLASAMCGIVPGPFTLIGARFLQGLAAGLMIPAGQAVIGSTANPKQLGRLMGVLGLVVALGPAVGPGIGGFILDAASWRWLFWINVPVGIAALAVGRAVVPGGSTVPDRPLDRKGLALLGIGLPLLLYGAAEIGSAGTTTITLLAVVIGIIMAAGFILTAHRADSPLIDLHLLRRGTFAAATATTGLTGANMYGGLLLLPLYLQFRMGLDIEETGLMLLVMGLGSAISLPFAGALTDRHGAGWVSLAGAGLLLVTIVPFLFPHILPTMLLVPILLGRGAGMALAQMPAMTAAYASVTPGQMGDAATLVNIIQRLGGATGAIAVVIMLAQAGDDTGHGAYTSAFVTLAAISTLTVVLAEILRQHTCARSTS